MTKCSEINSMYNEVGKLLNDICNFINEEACNGYLSPNGKSTAKFLIDRSKRQLEIIATAVSDPAAESYVDMHGAKVNYDYQDQNPQEVYSDVSLIFDKCSNTSAAEDEYVLCPYDNTPANMLLEGKRGDLIRKEKFLFFDKHREVYAAVQQPWLLIYNNKDSTKPNQMLDLTRYEAKPISDQVKDKRRDESFDLISSTYTKCFRFIAITEKDMIQWVCAINNSIENSQQRKSTFLPLHKELETDDLGDNDYEPLDKYQMAKLNVKPDPEIPLPLPPRNNEKIPSPLPSQILSQMSLRTPSQTLLKPPSRAPSRIPSEESLISTYDSVEPMTKTSDGASNSFSDDDSDQNYDDPAELKIDLKPSPNQNEEVEEEIEEDDIYDFLQPPIRLKEPVEEPKPPTKPKLFSFRNRKKN